MNSIEKILLSTGLILSSLPATAKIEDKIDELTLDTLTPGVAQRWVDRRYEVQTGRYACSKSSNEHIFWNFNGEYIGRTPNKQSKYLTQKQINKFRKEYKTHVLGSKKKYGYPFAGNCENPYQGKYEQGTDSYFETYLKGSWRQHKFENPTSIREIFIKVEENLRKSGEITYPKQIDYLSRGQYVIESGGDKKAKSNAGAIGIMQILPENLKNVCKVPKSSYYHRIAQIDCSKRIFQKDYEKLLPNFEKTFGHLEQKKQDELISLLTIQSYHTGPNRVNKIIDPNYKNYKVAKHFAQNHENFSAADIAFALMFHNYGGPIKLQSLTYTINVRSALNELEYKKRLK